MIQHRDGRGSTLLLVAANILIPIAIFIFATGFFPYKPLLPGLAHYETLSDYGAPPAPPFDKVVFMVIDALRSDFVYSTNSGFLFTQGLISNGDAIPFTAHATSPTVTMPRLKAITTGSIPSFLDVVLNLDEGDESSSLASQDTWLAQMKAKKSGKLVMYGDDTWLKLFPGTFDRQDGTTSFFVSDFTEVDNNVTRHIADELKRKDWNTMVLHYLGLDHIGHKGGPRSPHMIPKQREMDQIVQQIFTSLWSQPHHSKTLFVFCGDHGMNDAGNHGASSAGETSPALLFVSPKLQAVQTNAHAPLPENESFQYYSSVEQSDIAPTLAALLGFPIPKNNLGVLIPEFLSMWPKKEDQVQLLLRNAHQILDIITAAFGPEILDAANLTPENCAHPQTDYQELACEWQDISDAAKHAIVADDDVWITRTIKWLRKAQSLMSGMASNYDVPRLFIGAGVALVAVILAITATSKSIPEPASSFVPFGGIVLSYGIMMFASSYVEEEQHFWYWATTAWFGLLGLKGFRSNSPSSMQGMGSITALFALRLIRGWNQTGQKFAGESDIVKRFITSNPSLLWFLVGCTYLWIHREIISSLVSLPRSVRYSGATGLALAGITFKVAFTNEDAPELVVGSARKLLDMDLARGASLVTRARTVFYGLGFGVAVAVGMAISAKRKRARFPSRKADNQGIAALHDLYTLLAMTQSRTSNIPLFLLFNIINQYIRASSKNLTLIDLSISSLLLQFTAFFAFGGSNAISSVDLSNAYNGIADFNAPVVGILTYISNWAGSIYWTFATVNWLLALSRSRKESRDNAGTGMAVWKGHVAVLTVFVASSVAPVMMACTALRTHLFIWTVFSPKYLYCVAWGLGQHLGVNLALGGLLFWLGM
ncbi:GPI ethanolamine phosphate transferase 2 [Rhypophila decipiens]